jgi:hypothetical protein
MSIAVIKMMVAVTRFVTSTPSGVE